MLLVAENFKFHAGTEAYTAMYTQRRHGDTRGLSLAMAEYLTNPYMERFGQYEEFT